MNLGLKLKNERKKQGISMSTLSNLSKVSKTTISEIENNKVNPTINTLKKLANSLNVDVNFFVDEENKENWKTEIIKNDNFIGIDKKTFLTADTIKREAFLNDLSDLPLYQVKINIVSDLIKQHNDSKLETAYNSMLQSLINEINNKNELINQLKESLKKEKNDKNLALFNMCLETISLVETTEMYEKSFYEKQTAQANSFKVEYIRHKGQTHNTIELYPNIKVGDDSNGNQEE